MDTQRLCNWDIRIGDIVRVKGSSECVDMRVEVFLDSEGLGRFGSGESVEAGGWGLENVRNMGKRLLSNVGEEKSGCGSLHVLSISGGRIHHSTSLTRRPVTTIPYDTQAQVEGKGDSTPPIPFLF